MICTLAEGDAMKKIEEAAKERAGDGLTGLAWTNGFRGGARYVLDAMTSEEAVKLARFVHMLRGTPEDQLAAVRKEIEG